MKRKQYIILVIFLCCTSIVFSNTIYFDLSYVIKEPLHYTINDAKALLKQGNVIVSETLINMLTGK